MYIFICEDITGEVQSQRDRETPGGVSVFSEMAFMVQRLGIAIIFVMHLISTLSPVLRNNIPRWVIFAQPGEDPYLICSCLNVDMKKAMKIKILQPGEFAFFDPGFWSKALYATFKPLIIPGILYEDQRKLIVEEFLAEVRTEPPFDPYKSDIGDKQPERENKDNGSDTITSDQLLLLISIASSMILPITVHYDNLNLTRAQGRRLSSRLEDIGIIIKHKISTGKVGGQFVFYEISDYGWKLLEHKGIRKPKSLTNGDYEHDLAAYLIQNYANMNNLTVDFEVDLAGIRADAVLKDKKTGAKTCINIGISNPEYEVKSIEKFFRLPVSSSYKFILVVRDSDFAKKVKAILKNNKSLLDSFEIKLVSEFINY